MASFDHEAVPPIMLCGVCKQPVWECIYEDWHHQGEECVCVIYLATRDQPDPERSFQEMKARYLKTGEKPKDPEREQRYAK